jgi:hypothetical protein
MPINYKEYPSNWKTEIRPTILERAGHKCEFCGVKNYSYIYRFGKRKEEWIYSSDCDSPYEKKIIKVSLAIAHLDTNDKSDNIDRLVALCQKCHINYDKGQQAKNRKYGRLHSKVNLKLDL